MEARTLLVGPPEVCKTPNTAPTIISPSRSALSKGVADFGAALAEKTAVKSMATMAKRAVVFMPQECLVWALLGVA